MKTATTAQELFLQANQLYTQKQYQKALELYGQMPAKGPAVWYNMGNCAHQLHDDLHALLYWKRAEHGPCVLLWQILFFCAFSVFLISSWYGLRRKKIMIMIAGSLLLVLVGYPTYLAYHRSTTAQGLIMSSATTVYAGPDITYHQLGNIPAGTLVNVHTRKQNWTKIAWGNTKGWISDSEFEIL